MTFPLVVTESNIFTINVPVARFQLSDQRTFGYLSATQKSIWTDIVSKRGKQQAVFPELSEHRTELTLAFSLKRIACSIIIVCAEVLV